MSGKASGGSDKGLIVVENLGFSHGTARVLSDVSFKIDPGTHVALLGRSGAGKSTLLSLLSGIHRPQHGRVLIDGKAPKESEHRPALMFQRPALLPWLTAYENILLPLRYSGLLRRDPAAARATVETLIGKIGLADRATALPTNLSGGQQQRVALARALAGAPSVLLLDEPFSALDAEMRAGLRSDIRALASATGITLVTVTHDLSDAAAMADRVLVMGGTPSTIEDDFELGPDPERHIRMRLTNVRAAA